MTTATVDNLPRRPWLEARPYLVWFVPMLSYVILVIPAVWLRRQQINPDGVCYIRLAMYLLKGDWGHAFSGYWSPLFPLCIAPLIATGMSGLLAAHVVLAISGAAFLLMSFRLLRHLKGLTPAAMLWIMMIGVIITVRLAVKIVTPDLLMAAVLMGYLAMMARPDTLRRGFVAGCAGGVAYLAKAYALPFFLVHFPLTLLARFVVWRREGNDTRRPWKALGAAMALGLLGCGLVAVPWIAVLSHSYGQVTMGTAGAINHNQAMGGPRELRRHPGFFVPPDPYIVENEIFDRQVTRFWSPFESVQRLRQQWDVIRGNIPRIIRTLARFDGIGLVPLTLLATVILVTAGFLLRRPLDWRVPWLAMTLLVYCSGFALVVFEDRYLEAPLRFCAAMMCVLAAMALQARLRSAARTPHWLQRLVVPAVLLLCSISALADLPGAFRRPISDDFPREIAAAMRDARLDGPLACNNRGFGIYTAFFLDAKLIQISPDGDDVVWKRECRRGEVRSIVVCRSLRGSPDASEEGCAAMLRHGGWTRRLHIEGVNGRVEVYSRSDE